MLEIVKNQYELICENCKEEKTNNILKMDGTYLDLILCDKCLQELNHKIVEHLI